MCFYPFTRMACGHQEVARIVIDNPMDKAFATLYFQSQQPTANRANACNDFCSPLAELRNRGVELRSGQMCGLCRVTTGKILDGLIQNRDEVESKDTNPFLMSGGLDPYVPNINPEGELRDFHHHLSEGEGYPVQSWIMPNVEGVDVVDSTAGSISNDLGHFEPTTETSSHARNLCGGFPIDDSLHMPEDGAAEWLDKNDNIEEMSTDSFSTAKLMQSSLKAIDDARTIKCSDCRHSDGTGPLIKFHNYIPPASTSDILAPPSTGRSSPILVRLLAHNTATESGHGKSGWVVCDGCGKQLHLQ